MKTSDLIRILEMAGWQQTRRVDDELIFNHPGKVILLSVPDVGNQPLKPELLNAIFRAAGLRARVHKKVILSPVNLLRRLQRLFN